MSPVDEARWHSLPYHSSERGPWGPRLSFTDDSSARDRLRLAKNDLKNWKKHPLKANPPINPRQSRTKQTKDTEEPTKQQADEANPTEGQSGQDKQAETTEEPMKQQAGEADSTEEQSRQDRQAEATQKPAKEQTSDADPTEKPSLLAKKPSARPLKRKRGKQQGEKEGATPKQRLPAKKKTNKHSEKKKAIRHRSSPAALAAQNISQGTLFNYWTTPELAGTSEIMEQQQEDQEDQEEKEDEKPSKKRLKRSITATEGFDSGRLVQEECDELMRQGWPKGITGSGSRTRKRMQLN